MVHSPSFRRRQRGSQRSSFVAFLLVASFGILFAGCNGPSDVSNEETFVFTEEDIAKYRNLASEDAATGTGSASTPYLEALPSGSGMTANGEVVLDLSLVETYRSMRAGSDGSGKDMYQVTNEFLNVRTQPSTTAESVARLVNGDALEVVEFLNATWAKVRLPGGKEGFVAHRYLSKMTSEEALANEKKRFEGMYYVSFGFVNMRKEPSQESEKIAEIPGQTILKPVQVDGGWGRVTYDGKEGFVSMSYLAAFLPNFLVRQERYVLPVLHYRLAGEQDDALLQGLVKHAAQLRAEGMSFMTMRDLHALLKAQQQRDVRLDPKRVIIAVSGITPDTVKRVSDLLSASGIPATLFLETRHVGLSGITEKMIITLIANGFDIQSATHTGDDLRALTNAQVALELKQSRSILEEFTHQPVMAIAYPHGGANDRVMQLAEEAGYLFGISDDADRAFHRSQFLRIPAFAIFPSMTVEEVLKFVKGS